METKVFENLKELKKYYNEETNTYIFKEGENWFNVDIQFKLEITANINARDINAWDIVFYAICVARQTLVCKSITGERNNAKYLCLDFEPVIKQAKEENK